jgi:hypothetical protein
MVYVTTNWGNGIMNIKFPGTSLDDSRCPSAVQEFLGSIAFI